MRPLVKRQRAVAATMERFRGKEFALGSTDCLKMVAFHLRQLGHKVPLSKAGNYRTLLAAKKALKRAGCSNVMEAMDKMGLERIPPAFALTGDVISFPAEDPIGALGIYIGNGNTLGFRDGFALPVVMEVNSVDIAWRALK